MTPEERKSFENGIWLCQSCSKLIDTDITRYPKELLQSWKQLAEQTAILEVETTSSTPAFEKIKSLSNFIWSALIVQPFKMTFIKKVEWRILIKRLKIR